MTRIPMEAYMQKDLRAGREEVAPIPNAMKFVTEVMVMATPACAITPPTLSTTGLDRSCSETGDNFDNVDGMDWKSTAVYNFRHGDINN